MRLALVALLGLTLLPACKKSPLADVADPRFKVGQRWNYWARPGEEASTFTIEKIESHTTLGILIHVGLDNLQLKQGGKTVGLIPHMVFTRAAIEKSVAKLSEEDAALPPFQPDYTAWKKQMDSQGSAQVSTSGIADTLTALEAAP